VKVNMKHQLSKAKVGNLKQFCYGSVLVTFCLEWILLFHYILPELDSPLPRDAQMVRWSALMLGITGGKHMSYNLALFSWI